MEGDNKPDDALGMIGLSTYPELAHPSLHRALSNHTSVASKLMHMPTIAPAMSYIDEVHDLPASREPCWTRDLKQGKGAGQSNS